ncbi:apolipoprotein N-acyltransferase [Constrictibacter sp. MBR-5]
MIPGDRRSAAPWDARLHGTLTRLARRCAGLEGWRRWLVAWGAGAAAALAMPPIGLVPVLFFAFPVLVWLVDGAQRRRAAFAVGWWFGFGYFVVGLYWISNALLVDPEQFAWLIPFAVCGLPALLAIFTGLATLTSALWRGRGPGRVLLLAASWSAMEWLRGHAFTGFPWNLLGYAWADSAAMLQVTSVVGIYGLSLLTVLAAAAPAALADPHGDSDARRAWILPAAALAMLAVLWAGGMARLSEPAVGSVDGVRLRIVQANIPQSLKWDDSQRVANVRRYLDMSAAPAAPGTPPPTHIVWPETAVPFFLNAEPQVIAALAQVAPPGGALITGAPRIERGVASGEHGGTRIWNSVISIDSTGAIVATYDKFHLVPFGEYVPFRSVLGLAKITPGTVDFSAGPGPRTLDIPGAPPVSPLVCYEAIFPGRVTEPEPPPAWLLNVTNDAWYGRSAGPYQHLQIARVRAVEQGLPLVRAANTGISAIIDPHGRVVERLPLGETGVIDAALPAPIATGTVYARLGDTIFAAMLLFVFGGSYKLRHGWQRRVVGGG